MRSGRLERWVGHDRWAAAEQLVARRGGPAVFLARWVGVLRAVVPAAAGAAGVPRAVFLAWNAIGGALWATVVVGAGFLAGASWPAVQHALNTAGLVAGGAALLVVLAIVVRRHVRSRPRTRPHVAAVPGSGDDGASATKSGRGR